MSEHVKIITAIGLIIIVVAALIIAGYQGLHEFWFNCIELLVLAITAWALIVYAADVRKQTNTQTGQAETMIKQNQIQEEQTRYISTQTDLHSKQTALLLRTNIQPQLSQNANVLHPEIKTAALFHVTNPTRLDLGARVKLKLWVAGNRVGYKGGGMYDGTETWFFIEGGYGGVIEPGKTINDFIEAQFSSSLDLFKLLANDPEVPASIRKMPMHERIRAQLWVRHAVPEEEGEENNIRETPSQMYYLQIMDKAKKEYLWIYDYKLTGYPPDAFKFDD